MTAYCGIQCVVCPAYKATVNDDNRMRQETAGQWSKMYKHDIKPEQINCLGCRSEKHFGYCDMCEIRACCRAKSLKHCGRCMDFACSKVTRILDAVPGARERLLADKK